MRLKLLNETTLMINKFVIYREIYRFQESSQDKNVTMDCLILPDKAEIPNGLDESADSIVRVSSIVMRKISGLQSTDSIDAIALMKIPASFSNLDDDQKYCQKWFPSAHRILVLDGIQVTLNIAFRFNHQLSGFCLVNIAAYSMKRSCELYNV